MRHPGTPSWRFGSFALASCALACPLSAQSEQVAAADASNRAISAAPAPADPGTVEVALEPRVQRTWRLHLPAESWSPVGKLLDFTGGLGRAYATELSGTSLKLDTDGDGELDVTVEAPEGLVVLEGERSRHGLRLRYAEGW